MMRMRISAEIQEYIDFVRSEKVPVCKDQFVLCDYVEKCFAEESIYVDEQQLKRYLNQQQYFPFELLPWEKFIFTLHNCTYKAPGVLRWPVLFVYVGRGAGKNGYLAFESFCWITPINGVKEFNVDIFATSEEQAKTSPGDVRAVLEANRVKLEKYFYWNLEYIKNLKTGSEIRFHTSAPGTKDGGRPGAVVFDEFHAYQNYKLIGTARTGLGKKAMPRQTIITTDGNIRGGPLDDTKARAEQILYGKIGDNGMLPYICRLDDVKEVDNPAMWPKANPSYIYMPNLQQEMATEYADYKINPAANSDFMTKRMNMPQTYEAESVTDWKNILAAKKSLPDLTGCSCVAGIDYMMTTDFLTAGLLFKHKGFYCWIQHSWVCRASPDLPRIHAPLEEWEKLGYLTFVDGPEISPDVPAAWLANMAQRYNITVLGLDNFRYTLLTKALREAGFDTDKGGANNILLTKRVTENRYVPVITSLFNTQKICWGDDPMMGWYTYNACVMTEGSNQYYGKKEAKSRKTDGFKAMVAAICASENLADSGEESTLDDFKVYSY
jgi:phage terminase large subunit-like protein